MGIETLLQLIKNYSAKDKELIIRAYEFACEVHKNQTRKSGEPYITHPIAVACILAKLHADADTVVAGLLHDCIEDGYGITKELLAKVFNPTIALLVDGVTKIEKINFNNDKHLAEEASTQKMLIGIISDIRILIVKLADRLHNMRTLEFHKPAKQIEISFETMDFFIPFATLIGEYTLKLELEDLSFRYLNPREYQNMQKLKEQLLKDNRRVLDEVIIEVSQMLNSRNIPFDVKLNIKNLYGLYKRLKEHGKIENVHDVFSVNFLLNTELDCYDVRDEISKMYSVLTDKSKDYIKNPKTNMYRSLHTSVISPNKRIIQFQIKTPEMDMINSYGITAYWSLLKNQNRLTPAEKMQDDIKKFQFFQILEELVNMNVSASEFNQEVKNDILANKIYVSTPDEEIIELPHNSTPVDFAYKIHSDLGNYIIAAIVNGERVPLDYKLNNKDSVRIIAKKDLIGPRIDTEPFCKTESAKRKVKEFYKTIYK